MNVYCGRRKSKEDPSPEVWRNGKPFHVERSLKVRRHSPTGFEWGFCGSGPAQLALALLLDVFKSTRTALLWYQQFKSEIVSGLSEEWVLTEEDVQTWWRSATPSATVEENADGSTAQ